MPEGQSSLQEAMARIMGMPAGGTPAAAQATPQGAVNFAPQSAYSGNLTAPTPATAAEVTNRIVAAATQPVLQPTAVVAARPVAVTAKPAATAVTSTATTAPLSAAQQYAAAMQQYQAAMQQRAMGTNTTALMPTAPSWTNPAYGRSY
jgi:hypothetical protein